MSGTLTPGGWATEDIMLAIPASGVPEVVGVNKFGCATNVDSGVATDIWDGANATDDQPIWLAPTAARVHAIVSSHASDDGDPGAGQVRVYGLQTWDSKESSELVTLNGTTPVNTVNSYVIIHRMHVVGGIGINVGVISATAATDGTLTAQINAGEGQTQMAIYGVPSLQTMYLTQFYAGVLRTVSSALADIRLRWYHDIENYPTISTTKHISSIAQVGSTYMRHEFRPFNKFEGPGVLKLVGAANANDVTVTGGFDAILIDN